MRSPSASSSSVDVHIDANTGIPGNHVLGGGDIRASPLWRTARWHRPSEPGETRWELTLNAPKDSPNSVTFAGSPPNSAMLRRTHLRAACWSSRPNGSRSDNSG